MSFPIRRYSRLTQLQPAQLPPDHNRGPRKESPRWESKLPWLLSLSPKQRMWLPAHCCLWRRVLQMFVIFGIWKMILRLNKRFQSSFHRLQVKPGTSHRPEKHRKKVNGLWVSVGSQGCLYFRSWDDFVFFFFSFFSSPGPSLSTLLLTEQFALLRTPYVTCKHLWHWRL